MSVFVLGHRGMLGHVVARFLAEQGLEVLTTEARYAGVPGDSLITAATESGADWIINCVGKFRQETAAGTELLLANSLLPVHLKEFMRSGQKMIHASSDGVFSGARGSYKLTDRRDAGDAYGLSKSLGEVVGETGKVLAIRTSIIGSEVATTTRLVSWLLSQSGAVNGFTNQFWNGITTLEWAKICLELIQGKVGMAAPIIQTASPERISKHELLKLIAEVWRHPIQIHPVAAPRALDRTLVPDLPRPAIRAQLQELRDWWIRPPL
jgi:dTDP-4-dehydrorhamnose reductase